jgi:hypothetical protein
VAFKIERALTALFGAFRLQSQGNLPRILQEQVQATIDLTPYALQACGLKTVTFGQGALALGVLGVYDQEEDWAVVGWGAYYAATAAGDLAAVQIDLVPEGQNSSFFVVADTSRNTTSGSNTAIAAGEFFGTRYNHAYMAPLWTKKGSRWQFTCSQVTGAPNGYGSILYYPLNAD